MSHSRVKVACSSPSWHIPSHVNRLADIKARKAIEFSGCCLLRGRNSHRRGPKTLHKSRSCSTLLPSAARSRHCTSVWVTDHNLSKIARVPVKTMPHTLRFSGFRGQSWICCTNIKRHCVYCYIFRSCLAHRAAQRVFAKTRMSVKCRREDGSTCQ